jgi:hypothetical protein
VRVLQTNANLGFKPSGPEYSTAPVSHQKRSHQSPTKESDSERKRKKINKPHRYPAAHNGLVAGSSLTGFSRIYGLRRSNRPAQGLLHQNRTILRDRCPGLAKQFTFQVSETTMACGRRGRLPRSAAGLSVPSSRSCQSALPNIETSRTPHDAPLHRGL